MSRAPKPDPFRVTPAMAFPAFLMRDGGTHGRCLDDPRPDDWTNDDHTAVAARARRRCVAVCRGCPFREECEEWAVETEQEGVYGATTTKERRAKERRRVAA